MPTNIITKTSWLQLTSISPKIKMHSFLTTMDILNFPNLRKRTNKFLGPLAIHCRQTASISEMNLEKKKPVTSDLFHPSIKYKLIFTRIKQRSICKLRWFIFCRLSTYQLSPREDPQFINVLNPLSRYVRDSKIWTI
jgi:hypothetical protein